MFSGIVRHTRAWAVAFFVVAAMPTGAIATADPGQDQKFFDLLGQKDIPPVDGEDGLITTAHKVCSKLDGGMAVGDMVELIRNNGFNDNPLTRLQNQGRITRTIHQFISAAVEAYCPYDKGKIASIAAFSAPDRGYVVVLASVARPLPAGEIGPTKPVPVPAQPPPTPEQLAPAPQEPPPPPPKRVQPAPPKQQQVEPPPQEAPPQEPPPDADMPQAPAPAPGGAPGGGNGASPAPENPAPSPEPAPPAPPGHVRLAP